MAVLERFETEIEIAERSVPLTGATLLWWSDTTPGRGDAEARGEADQLGDRSRLHLLHEMPALLLDGDFARPELARDLLVEETSDDPSQHVPLARGQQGVPASKRGELLTFAARGAIALDRAANGVEQILLAERLRQE